MVLSLRKRMMDNNCCDKKPKDFRNKMDTHKMTQINAICYDLTISMDQMLIVMIYKCVRDSLKELKNVKKKLKKKKSIKNHKR